MELLIAIATLCQVVGATSQNVITSNSYETVRNKQLNCQQNYIKCVKEKGKSNKIHPASIDLENCILEKK